MSYLDADTISVKFPCRVKAEVTDKEEESPDIGITVAASFLLV